MASQFICVTQFVYSHHVSKNFWVAAAEILQQNVQLT